MFSLNVRDQFSHPYKITSKMIKMNNSTTYCRHTSQSTALFCLWIWPKLRGGKYGYRLLKHVQQSSWRWALAFYLRFLTTLSVALTTGPIASNVNMINQW
jgi:hypothetical protein